MDELNRILDKYKEKLIKDRRISIDNLKDIDSVYPFNDFEYIISNLLANNYINIDEYMAIRNDYVERNKYLRLFELSPRTFGQTWGEDHIRKIVPQFLKPSKKIDKNYDGEYDLWFNGLKIEVKASRAVDKNNKKAPIMEKALPFGSKKNFVMNFQQLKPRCCDVYIWIAVWKDRITYWIIKSDDISKYHGFTSQHRGNIGEGQIFLTNKNIHDFDKYIVNENKLLSTIKNISK